MMKPWYPGGDAAASSSPDYFTIPVFDDFVGRIRSIRHPLREAAKRDQWRAARDAALLDWSASGLNFVVAEKRYNWIFPDDGQNHDLELFGQFDRGSIVFRRDPLEEGTAGTSQWIDDYGGVDVRVGICTFDSTVVSNLVAGMHKWVRGVICHEIGHVLGFGHNGLRADPPGDSNVGVMALGYGGGDFSPSDEELGAVKAYYKL